MKQWYKEYAKCWNGDSCIERVNVDCGEYDWWCEECRMAVSANDANANLCPNCGAAMTDMEEQIGIWESFRNGSSLP